MTHAARRRAASALVMLASVACAPVASFRPATGFLPGNSLEFGVGAVGIGQRPYVIEEPRAIGQLWISSEMSPRTNLSILSAFDDQALAFGVGLRFRLLRTPAFVAAVDGELGYLFAQFAVPLALALGDHLTLYAAPRLGNWGVDPIFGAPVGLSVRVYDGLFVRGEWQRSFQDFQRYNRRDHWCLAVAYQF